MKQQELQEILDKHLLWLNDDKGGERANLSSANLRYANLSSANLRYANLSSANLSSANLRYANLRYANLRYANLSSANLRYANLRYANLSSANLRYANLSYANLRYANLRYADLSSADLSSAAGNLRHLKSIFVDTYPVTYTSEILQIGCERHHISEWWEFSDKQILAMEGKAALNFWKKWKDHLKATIELSPAEPTGYEQKEDSAA